MLRPKAKRSRYFIKQNNDIYYELQFAFKE